MTMFAPGSSNSDEVTLPDEFLITIPDAERLSLQSRFVTNQFEAEILAELEERIREATLLEPSAAPPDLVTMNSQVVLRDLDDGAQMVFTLAFPSGANANKGRISVLTPLGSMLLGARIGQKIASPVGGSMRTLTVEAILHQPEASGDYYG